MDTQTCSSTVLHFASAWICDLGMAVAIVKPLTVHVSITWLTAFQFITFTIGLGSAQMGHTTNDDQMFLCM